MRSSLESTLPKRFRFIGASFAGGFEGLKFFLLRTWNSRPAYSTRTNQAGPFSCSSVTMPRACLVWHRGDSKSHPLAPIAPICRTIGQVLGGVSNGHLTRRIDQAVKNSTIGFFEAMKSQRDQTQIGEIIPCLREVNPHDGSYWNET
jgi:hypothetical protein